MTFLLTLRGTPDEKHAQWTEHIMNQAVQGLCDYLYVNAPAVCWYYVGEGVSVWRESDGRSPVEPPFAPALKADAVPGD